MRIKGYGECSIIEARKDQMRHKLQDEYKLLCWMMRFGRYVMLYGKYWAHTQN